MIKIGNDNANQLLEHKLPEDDKITPDANVYVTLKKTFWILLTVCHTVLVL